MRKVLVFVMLLGALASVSAQSAPRSTGISGQYLSCDPNGNVYVVEGAKLTKLDASGKKIATYEDFLLGEITSVDTDNPLKIMLFYRDAGKIVFIGDKLTAIAEPLDLFAQNYNHIDLATYSTDNRIWLYDRVSHDLLSTDFHLKELSRNHLTISELQPTQFLSLQEKKLVLVNDDGIIFFDAFGTELKSLPLTSDCPVQIEGERIFFVKDNALTSYNYQTLTQTTHYQFDSGVKGFVLSKGSLFFLDENNHLKIASDL